MITDGLRAKHLHPPIVCIADERREAVRLGVGLDVVAHALEARGRLGRNTLAVKLEQRVTRREGFEHKTVVRRGLLKVDAIRRDLIEDLRDDKIAAGREPFLSVRRGAEERAEKHETNAVTQIVVAVDIGALEMRRDELAVQIERAQKQRAKLLRTAGRRVGHEIETPDPADRAKRDVHRARPIDAPRVRIGVHPRAHFVREFLRVAVVARQPVRLAEPGEMLAATELPRHLHVGRPIELVVFDVAAVLQRPRLACFEIGQPRNLGAERDWPRPEQVELVPQRAIGISDDLIARRGVLAREHGRPRLSLAR